MISLVVLLEPGLLQRMIPLLDPKVPIFVVVLLLTALMSSLLGVILLYRRFRRSAIDASPSFSAAAAIGLILGILTVVGGMGHTAAIVSLALRGRREYGPSLILLFTTGAMLLYCGGMQVATYRGIRKGRTWALAVSAATVLLFCLYLALLLPLGPDSGPRLSLVMWTLYLVWLAVASWNHWRKPTVSCVLPC